MVSGATPEMVAIHEAGHAVMAHHFGIKLDNITIKPKLENIGSVKPGKYRNIPDKSAEKLWEVMQELAVIRLGGMAANYIGKGKPKKISTRGAEKDLESCIRFFSETVELEWNEQQIIDLFFDRAIEILESKWKAVKALTDALIECRTINGGGAKRIIEENL